jgi:hypothetical protein
MTVHSFGKSLRLSHEQADAPWWGEVYRKAIPGFASMTCVRGDGWAQRGGIDRVITLSSGKTVTVDEKVRSKDYPDILLEAWSDVDRQVEGWINKDLACDFIAYAFIPSQTCYLFPFLTLRAAWLKHGEAWWRLFPQKTAHNSGPRGSWKTVSLAVPIEILTGAVEDAMRVNWASAA